jgi:hypothetical protein
MRDGVRLCKEGFRLSLNPGQLQSSPKGACLRCWLTASLSAMSGSSDRIVLIEFSLVPDFPWVEADVHVEPSIGCVFGHLSLYHVLGILASLFLSITKSCGF